MILFRVLQAIFFARKKLVIYVIICLAAALFCINVMFGYTMQLYYSEYDATWYSTITIDNPEELTVSDFGKYMTSEFACDVGSVLYVKKISDHNILIGWEGEDTPIFWFPTVGGRFFSADEKDKGERVVYIDYNENEILEEDNVDIEGEKYDVIGYGFITVYNFLAAIGNQSEQTIFKNRNNGDEIYEEDYFRIVPYKAFCLDNNQPQLILIHIKEMSREELVGIVNKMKEQINGICLSIPASNPNNYLSKEQIRYIPSAFMLALIIVSSSIGIINQLLETTRDIIKVFRMCGISKNKLIVYLEIAIFILLVIAEVTAISLQIIILPILKYFDAGYMPTFQSIGIMLFIMYAIVGMMILPRIIKSTSVERDNIL